MTVEVSHHTASGGISSSNPAVWNFFSDIGRDQFAFATEIACAWLCSRETIHHAQQLAVHQALVRHEAAAQKLRSVQDVGEVASVYADLLRFHLERPGYYLQQLATTGLQAQIETMARVSRMFNSKTGNSLKLVLSTFQASRTANHDLPGSDTKDYDSQAIMQFIPEKSLPH